MNSKFPNDEFLPDINYEEDKKEILDYCEINQTDLAEELDYNFQFENGLTLYNSRWDD